MCRIKNGDADFGIFTESDLYRRIAKASSEGCDVFQVSNNWVISHPNGRVYVATLED